MGDAAILAEKIQELAPPGQVYVSGETRDLIVDLELPTVHTNTPINHPAGHAKASSSITSKPLTRNVTGGTRSSKISSADTTVIHEKQSSSAIFTTELQKTSLISFSRLPSNISTTGVLPQIGFMVPGTAENLTLASLQPVTIPTTIAFGLVFEGTQSIIRDYYAEPTLCFLLSKAESG
jgi:hypothetical protein